MAAVRPVEEVVLDVTREPAQTWRNLFSCDVPIDTQRNGFIGPGEFWGSGVYPSKEAAEEQAREDMAGQINYVLERGVRYLGAFPEDETP